MRFGLLVACSALLAAEAAVAHPAPFSYLDLHVSDRGVEGTLTLHVIDVAHDLGIDRPSILVDPAMAGRERPRIAALVSERLRMRAGNAPLSLEWTGLETAPERDAVRLSFRSAREVPGTLAIAARLFPYDPIHQTFVNVYEDGELRQQAVLNGSAPEQLYYRGTARGAMAVAATFVPAGIHHILIGPDHILFLVALLLLGGGWWPLIRIVTAFTIGHSITLSLAALDVLSPPATVIEPAIALSIVFVGADNLLVRTGGRDVRAWIALSFGLVHGFGFAYVLREFGLPAEALAWSLFFFNLGVELGQLVVVFVVAGALAVLSRRSRVAAQRVAFAGSLAVIAAGGYWFVERVFFPGGA